MEEFQAGEVYYHKATNKRCVVIKKNEDGTIKVRTSDDEEKNYFPQELKEPQSAIVKRGRNLY
jgi:hypothetical protein